MMVVVVVVAVLMLNLYACRAMMLDEALASDVIEAVLCCSKKWQ